MSDPRTEHIFKGVCASPGLAVGPLVRVSPVLKSAGHRKLSPAQERARLQQALQTARQELTALSDNEGGEVAAILEFQIEMAGDDELLQDTTQRIDDGAAAADAWWACLETHIEDYRGADDEYFQARTADLTDLRDRVAASLGVLVEDHAHAPAGAILLDDEFTPTRFLALDCEALGGLALSHGSTTSHVAMLARARGFPMITGLGEQPPETLQAILDAGDGILITDPEPATLNVYSDRADEWRRQEAQAREALNLPAVTRDGTRVATMINVDHPGAVPDEVLAAADGVGLMRTEFLYMNDGGAPDEASQYRIYTDLLDRLDGRPCVIRTFDVGGDKPVAGLTAVDESNPFLGLRGIRLSLESPDLFRLQVRALLRAAAGRPLKVMLPMIATPSEYREAREFFAAELAQLRTEGAAAEMPPLGIMVETPACAITIDAFDAPFYSIGSNDLTQYVMAASRDGGGRVAALNRPGQPAVQRLIEAVVQHGRRQDRPVSLCGDMGSDPDMIGALLDLGLDCLSVAPAALGRVKLAVRQHPSGRDQRPENHA